MTTVRRGISKEQIQQALKFRGTKWFDAKLLGGEVLLKELNANQGKAINDAANWGKEDYDGVLFTALIFQAGVINPETGEPMFELEEVEELREGRESAIDEVATEILRLNKMAPDSFRDGDTPPDAGQRDQDTSAGPVAYPPVITG